MFHLSRRRLLTMVVISAVSAPLCTYAAAPGAVVHILTNPVGLNTEDTQQVETVLGHLRIRYIIRIMHMGNRI